MQLCFFFCKLLVKNNLSYLLVSLEKRITSLFVSSNFVTTYLCIKPFRVIFSLKEYWKIYPVLQVFFSQKELLSSFHQFPSIFYLSIALAIKALESCLKALSTSTSTSKTLKITYLDHSDLCLLIFLVNWHIDTYIQGKPLLFVVFVDTCTGMAQPHLQVSFRFLYFCKLLHFSAQIWWCFNNLHRQLKWCSLIRNLIKINQWMHLTTLLKQSC